MIPKFFWAARRTTAWSLIVVSLFPAITARAATLELAWNPISDATLAGYNVYFGLLASGLTNVQDASLNTAAQVSNLVPGSTYWFAVTAYNSNLLESPFSNVITDSIPNLPAITDQPVSTTVIAGSPASLSVAATSTVPMGYQWFDGDNPVSNATNATLTINAASNGSAGQYSVVLSNSSGTVTSSAAVLTVLDPPVITVPPVAQTAVNGSTVKFTVGVSGTPPFSYQWYGGTTVLVGATNSALGLPGVTTASEGNYRVMVQNAAGLVDSVPVSLTVTNSAAPFIRLAGTYNGLFYQTNSSGITPQTAGSLGNLVLTTNGVYSGKVYLAGLTYSLSGTLNSTGADMETISRAASGLSNLSVTLQLDMTGASEQVKGEVSSFVGSNAWVSPLVALLATNAQVVPSGYLYGDLVTSSSVLAIEEPFIVYNNPSGVLTFGGYLPDSTYLSETCPLSSNGLIPIYASLYGGAGIVEGWMNVADGLPTGSVVWLRPAGVAIPVGYPLGATNTLVIQGMPSPGGAIGLK